MALVKSFLAFFLALAGTKIEGARATKKTPFKLLLDL